MFVCGYCSGVGSVTRLSLIVFLVRLVPEREGGGVGGRDKLLWVPSIQCYRFVSYCALPVDVPGWGGSLFCAKVAVQVAGSFDRGR